MRTGLMVGLMLMLAGGASALAAPAPLGTSVSMKLQRTVPLPGDGGWDYLTFDEAHDRLFIARGTHVMVVSTKDDKVVGDIPDTDGVHGVALAPALHRGFTSNGREGTVTEFDFESLKPLAKIKVGQNPDAIVFDDASGRVFTLNGKSNDATAIDAASGKVVGTVPLGGKPEFAVVDHHGRLFVNIEDKSEIADIDTKGLKERHRWSVAPGSEPSGLALDAAHHRLYAVCDNEKMVVLDDRDGKVLGTPAIGDGPDAAAYDAGNGLAYSSNGKSGNLTVVRGMQAVATVPTRAGARTMAVNPRTHEVYLVTAKVASQEGRRRTYVPGTFELLIVGPAK